MKNRRSTALKALVIAVATPNLVTNALAAAEPNVAASPRYGDFASNADNVIFAQKRQTMTAEEAKLAVRNELVKMTTAQKARLGRSQVELEVLVVEPTNLTKCTLTLTGGAPCTDPFSGGITCCIATLAPPP